MSTRRLLVIGVVAASVAALVGGALAIAADGDGSTVNVCAKKRDGDLRLDLGDGCRSNEIALELPTARTSFVSRRDLHDEPLEVPDDWGPIHTMTVPDDGLFALIATVEFVSHNNVQRTTFECELQGEFTTTFIEAETPEIASVVVVPLVGIGDGGVFEIRCKDAGEGVLVQQVTVIALAIDGLFDVSGG